VRAQLLRTLGAQPQEHRFALVVTGLVAELNIDAKEFACIVGRAGGGTSMVGALPEHHEALV
jgi:alpha-galactosidase/6-phospho-beta-glucosidase family protein